MGMILNESFPLSRPLASAISVLIGYTIGRLFIAVAYAKHARMVRKHLISRQMYFL